MSIRGYCEASLFLVFLFLTKQGCIGHSDAGCPQQYGCHCKVVGKDYVVSCGSVSSTNIGLILTDIPLNVTNLTMSGDLSSISHFQKPFSNFSVLLELRLDHGNITSLPASAFDGLGRVKVLSLGNNRITSGLPSGVFKPLTSLVALNISQNKLLTVAKESFQACKTLESLDLSTNLIGDLKESVFSDLTGLKILNLSNNQINNPPSDLFKSCVKLETLDLASNIFTTLNNNTFLPLRSLKVLNLSKNNFGYLTLDMFRGLKNLTVLDLSENKGVKWHKNAFSDLGSLETLLLRGVMEPGHPFPPSFLNHLTSLRNLDLSLNDISCVSTDCFNWTAVNKTLVSLDLSGNEVKPLRPKMFSILPKLRSLSLKANQLNGYPEGIFDGLDQLWELHLDNNPFKTLNNLTNTSLPALKLLAFVGCGIVTVAPGALKGLPKLQTLNLTNNDFHAMTPDTFNDVINSSIVVSNNPWVCNCSQLYQAKKWIGENNINIDIVCASPKAQVGKHLKNISDVDLGCQRSTIKTNGNQVVSLGNNLTLTCISSGNPNPAVTFFLPNGSRIMRGDRANFSSDNQTLVFSYIIPEEGGNFSCRAVNIVSAATANITVIVTKDPSCPVPNQCSCQENFVKCSGLPYLLAEVTFKNLPNATLRVVVRGDIRELRANFLTHLPNLTNILLSDSNMTTIEAGVFTSTSLQEIDLHGNRIQSLPDECFKGLKRLKNLNLRQNVLSKLGKDLFIGCALLTELDLGLNEIAYLSETVFSGLMNLRSLDLQRNRLGRINRYAFLDLKNLTTLNLENNFNLNMSDALRHLGNLETLNLRNVTADQALLKCLTLQGLSSLKDLDMSSNNISCLKCISWTPVSESLERLLLDNNNVEVLEGDAFNLTALQYLYVRNSNITEIQTGAFRGMAGLIQLDLEGNNMTTVDGNSFGFLVSLASLHINASNIHTISPNAFKDLKQLTYLDMRSNALMTLLWEVFHSLPLEGVVVKTGGNPWQCNCSMFHLKHWMIAANSTIEITCQGPESVANISLVHIDDDELEGCTPPIINTTSNVIIDRYIGGDFTVNCEVDGMPEPTLTYEVLSGDPLPENRTKYGDRNATLTVEGLQDHNSGMFACVAKNFKGTQEILFNVTVSGNNPRRSSVNMLLGVGFGVATLLVLLIAGIAFGIRKWRRDRLLRYARMENLESPL